LALISLPRAPATVFSALQENFPHRLQQQAFQTVKYAQPTVTLQQEVLFGQIAPVMLDISKDQMLSVIYAWKVRGARMVHRVCAPSIKMQTQEALLYQTARAMKDSS